MEEALKDKRFNHILTDPRFHKMPRNISKVAIDKRFKGMFEDNKFKGKCVLDKRGRPLDLTSAENLRKLYAVSSESSESDIENDESRKEEGGANSVQTSDDGVLEKMNEQISKNGKNTNSKMTMGLCGVASKVVENKSLEDKEIREITSEKLNLNCSSLNERQASKVQNELFFEVESEVLSNKELCNSINAKSLNRENLKITSLSKKSSVPMTKIKTGRSLTEMKYSEDEEELSDKVEGGKNSEDGADEKDSSEESDDCDEAESDDSSKGKQSGDFDHHWEELRNEAPNTDEITQRLAVCNMDWDRIRAEDLFVCFNSFKPTAGCINSVKIYPSEYGLKRMEKEKMNGPPELVEETLSPDEEDKKGSKYHREKLRQYQMNRLKYYYAVLDCDSPGTANALYEQLNGMEYESSSVIFDLRFIPDSVTFDQKPIVVADKLSNPAEYKPRLFVTAALQQVKVNLTWDETDPKRREALQKAFTEQNNIEKDINDYLASSSEESEEEEEQQQEAKLSTRDRISKYKDLLLSLEEKKEDKKYEIEITWEPGLKEKTEEAVKERLRKDQPFEEKKLEERKLAVQNEFDDEDEYVYSNDELLGNSISNAKDKDVKILAELALISDSKKELQIKPSKKSRLRKTKERSPKDNFQLDVNDPRFSAIYSSHLFNIDPSDPHYKDTEGNRALIEEKQRKLKSVEFHGSYKNTKRARYC